ncbi:hypothetical protein FH609_004095 [Streptomyces sp. 3MP-14]|uniref:Uncharacterized protein n=1 Tax=Streptomyces mimosae TaxID=2586635 RepID=A0A5N6A4S0_9ACTN|nr:MULTISPECIES: hypothetical protein [Streptomyces]KAB8162916.1 hypothetical protein FH607_019960 [Streptomyces mimosae]KAB8179129.1 hypothetical protein FH609_004095 [Streptomyces sp. 3MP-14]
MPWPWQPGMVVTAARLEEGRLRRVEQPSDITITSSITPQSTDLVWDVVAGAVYAYWASLSYSATTNSDFRWNWALPSGSGASRGIVGFDPANTSAGVGTGGAVLLRRPAPGTQIVIGGKDASSPPGDFRVALDQGIITIGSVAGVARVQVAQGASHADQTIFRAQSTVVYQRIG